MRQFILALFVALTSVGCTTVYYEEPYAPLPKAYVIKEAPPHTSTWSRAYTAPATRLIVIPAPAPHVHVQKVPDHHVHRHGVHQHRNRGEHGRPDSSRGKAPEAKTAPPARNANENRSPPPKGAARDDKSRGNDRK